MNRADRRRAAREKGPAVDIDQVRRDAGCPHDSPPNVVTWHGPPRRAAFECAECGVHFDPRG